MKTLHSFFLLCVLIGSALLILEGCSSSRRSGCSYCLSPDTIIVSSGGGFSGFYNFYSIASSGSIRSWQQRTGTMRDTIFAERTIDCDSVAFYFEFLNRIDFASINYSHNGNMNYKIERRSSGKNHVVSWGDSDPSAPREAVVFYTLLSHAARRWAESSGK